MQTKALPSSKGDSLQTRVLPGFIDGWSLECEIRQCSRRTVEKRSLLLSKFLWFLQQRENETVDRLACRQFLRYLSQGHADGGGRWVLAGTKPSTVNSFHSTLRAFFNWVREEEDSNASPVDKVPQAIDRKDQVQPFTDQQVVRLCKTAKTTYHPRRDEAIVLFLLNTGIRISKLYGLQM